VIHPRPFMPLDWSFVISTSMVENAGLKEECDVF
jgi:hypothetical protein